MICTTVTRDSCFDPSLTNQLTVQYTRFTSHFLIVTLIDENFYKLNYDGPIATSTCTSLTRWCRGSCYFATRCVTNYCSFCCCISESMFHNITYTAYTIMYKDLNIYKLKFYCLAHTEILFYLLLPVYVSRSFLSCPFVLHV